MFVVAYENIFVCKYKTLRFRKHIALKIFPQKRFDFKFVQNYLFFNKFEHGNNNTWKFEFK